MKKYSVEKQQNIIFIFYLLISFNVRVKQTLFQVLLAHYFPGKEDCLVCKRHQQANEKIYHDEGVMTSLSERVEKDSIDQEVQHINENSKKLHECPIGGCNYSNIVITELAEHVLTHFPPIRIDDEFDQLCLEQLPSVV